MTLSLEKYEHTADPKVEDNFNFLDDIETIKNLQDYVEIMGVNDKLPAYIEELKGLNIAVDQKRATAIIDKIVDFALNFDDANMTVVDAVREMSRNNKDMMGLFLQRYAAKVDVPDMTSYAFIGNPNDVVGRNIAGGTLIIETTVAGEKTMVIRGFNPRQNILAKSNAADFVESFIDNKLIEDAKRLGVKRIVAPVFSLGALSNRQEVLTHFKETYLSAQRVNLDEKINFNGYNITESCVVVRTLE